MLVGKLTGTGSLKGTLSGTGSLRGTLSGGGVGHGIPAGGEPGQGLIKASDADYDVKWMSILPEDTASGAVASFPDGADDLPMGVVVDIDPVQDLHGYDNPWPEGGGKNLFDKTKVANVAERVSVEQIDNGFKITNLSTGTYKSTSFYADFAGHDGATVYLKGNVSNSGSNNGYFSVRFYDDTSELTTGATRVELYSNRTSHTGTVPTGTTRIVFVIYGTGNRSAAVGDTSTFTNVIFSLSNDAYSPYSNICPISGWTKATISHSGADTSNPTEYEIPFSTEVYGGKLNVETGELVIDKGRKVFDGTEGWFNNGSHGVALSLSSISPSMNAQIVPSAGTFIFDEYKAIAAGQAPQDNGCVNLNANRTAIQIHDERGMTAASYKTFLNGHNITMVYALATPITLTLDPVEIRSLLGDNNVWSDTGDVSVTYLADVQKYIDKKISAAVAAMS